MILQYFTSVSRYNKDKTTKIGGTITWSYKKSTKHCSGAMSTGYPRDQERTGAGLGTQADPQRGLLAAMEVIGIKFKNNSLRPEVLIAARAMNAGMEVLKPRLIETGVEPIGTVVLGTVKGDLHDIGKNLVRMMFEGSGLTVHDLGVDVSAERFVEAIKEYKPQIVGMSALLTTTMGEMKATIEAIKAAGLRDQVKIMVGEPRLLLSLPRKWARTCTPRTQRKQLLKRRSWFPKNSQGGYYETH